MKVLVFFLLLIIAPALVAQEAPKKGKPRAKKEQQVAHKKPTPEQIRKFKELEKKQKKG